MLFKIQDLIYNSSTIKHIDEIKLRKYVLLVQLHANYILKKIQQVL